MVPFSNVQHKIYIEDHKANKFFFTRDDVRTRLHAYKAHANSTTKAFVD